MINNYIHKHGKRLYGLCLHLCSNPHDADDLYQETWMKAMKNIDRYDPAAPFEPWITRICVNTHKNVLRGIARSPVLNFHSNEEKEHVLQSVIAPKEADYRELYDAIDRLPDKLRMTVILFYFREMDIESTAEVLSIPVGTVKSRLNKARKLLKEVLTSEADLQF